MKNNNGWIKLHRKILENPIIKKPNYFTLWSILLLLANHKENKFMWNDNILIIKEGQLLTSRDKLKEITDIPTSTIEDILTFLEKSQHQIQQQKTTKFRIITIINWKEYQNTNTKSNNKATTKQQQSNTNKNGKNNKNDKNIYSETSSQEVFDFDLLKEKMEKSEKDPRMPIIALYWTYKGIEFKNKEQYTAGLKRELRAAQNLRGYKLDRIKEIMFALNGTGIDWTLETTHKYADRDLTKLNNFNK